MTTRDWRPRPGGRGNGWRGSSPACTATSRHKQQVSGPPRQQVDDVATPYVQARESKVPQDRRVATSRIFQRIAQNREQAKVQLPARKDSVFVGLPCDGGDGGGDPRSSNGNRTERAAEMSRTNAACLARSTSMAACASDSHPLSLPNHCSERRTSPARYASPTRRWTRSQGPCTSMLSSTHKPKPNSIWMSTGVMATVR